MTYTAKTAKELREEKGSLLEKLATELASIQDGNDPTYIVVSTSGSDTTGTGSWQNPYATLTKAMTAVTTARKAIYIMPGDYAEAAMITWPSVNGVIVKGMDGNGNVVISNANAAAAVITIDPAFTTASFEAFLENVCIEHSAQIGLKVDNAGMGTRKLIIHLKSVSMSQVSTGNSITVAHTTAGQAIRLYAEDCDEIEGLVGFTTATADDRARFRNSTLIGGLTVTGAIASEVTLLHTVVLASGLTVDAAQVLTYRGCAYRTDAGVYSELADAYST
jgi:pectin methylesterase-like acyl-CoA thioesterase